MSTRPKDRQAAAMAVSARPAGLLQTLAALEKHLPYVLLIRHAERAPLDAQNPFADVDLTERGEQLAAALAHALPAALHWAAVSPFLRCRRTAECLGIQHIELDNRLGDPGPWVLDSQAGARLFSELGTEGVVRAQLAGTRWSFIREASAGTQFLLSAAVDRLRAGRAAGVCVSHDAVLMPVLATLAGERFVGTWLQPLDGFAIQSVRGTLRCIWRGLHLEVATW